jgi:hypothetical protein
MLKTVKAEIQEIAFLSLLFQAIDLAQFSPLGDAKPQCEKEA